MKQRLIYQDDKSNKFWEVEVKGKEMVVRYGKIGTDGQVTVKKFASTSDAETAAEKAITEKLKKGYRNQENIGGDNDSKNRKICIIAGVTAEQAFDIFDNAPSDKVILKNFKALKFTLDPAPPCEWTYDLQNVEVSINRKAKTLSRTFSLSIYINIDERSIEAVKEMMGNEGYFDEDDGFDWSSAINYFIADTTVAPDYANFESENVDISIMDVTS